MSKARELNNTEPNGEVDKKLETGKFDDLIEAKYEKTIYVKIWKGKTITAKINLKHTVESMKELIKERTKIPKEDLHLVSKEKNTEGLQHE